MTGVEVISAALAAGATAGVTGAASSAVQDAYLGLREVLRRRLSGRPRAVQALQAEEVEPAVWQSELGADLTGSGADQDEQILNAARQLLALVDPAGKYDVDLRSASGVQVGDGTVQVATNYGAAGTITGPVTITYGQLPVPPAPPAAI